MKVLKYNVRFSFFMGAKEEILEMTMIDINKVTLTLGGVSKIDCLHILHAWEAKIVHIYCLQDIWCVLAVISLCDFE